MSRRLKYASITCLVALATLVSPAQALQFAPLTTPESAQVGTLYASGTDVYTLAGHRIFKSADGLSWTELVPPPGRLPSFLVAGAGRISVLVDGVVWTSNDDGATWLDITGEFQGNVSSIFAAGPQLFVYTSEFDAQFQLTPRLYRWDGSGTNYTLVTPPGLSTGIQSLVQAGNNICLSVANSGVRWSPNAGDSWNTASGVSGNVGTLVASADGSTVFGSTRRSTNNCQNFGNLSITPSGLIIRAIDAAGNYYAEDGKGNLFTSTGGSGTFSANNSGDLPADSQIRITSGVDVAGGFLLGTTGLGVVSNVGGDWAGVNQGLFGSHIAALIPQDAGTDAVGLGQYGGYFESADAASAAFLGKNSGLRLRRVNDVLKIGANTLLAATDAATDFSTFPATGTPGLFRPTDNGATWTQADASSSGLPSGASIGQLIQVGSRVFANVTGVIEGNRGVYQSDDNGASWTANANLSASNIFIRNMAARGSTLWVYVSNSGVQRSTDGGDTVTAVNNGLNGNKFGKIFATPGALIASAGGNTVYYSTDDGDNWQAASGFAISRFGIELLSMAEDNDGVIYLGDEHAGLSVSSDAGVSWTPDSDGLQQAEVCIPRVQSLLHKNGKIYVGSGGSGVFVADKLGAGTAGDSIECTTDLDVFPNNFSFQAQQNVAPDTLVQSNTATISGLADGVSVPVSVTDGEYSIGCDGVFTAQPGEIGNGSVCVRHTSASIGETTVSTELTVGNTSASFNSTTGLVFTGRDDEINTNFGNGGLAINTAVNQPATGVLIEADGSLIVAANALVNGSFSNLGFAVTRFNADGSQGSFSGPGSNEIVIDIADGSDQLRAVLRQPDGKLILVGTSVDGNGTPQNGSDDVRSIALVRLNADGSLDSSFGTAGIANVDVNPTDQTRQELVYDAILLDDGSIVVGGWVVTSGAGGRFFVIKFNADGSVDTGFGNNESEKFIAGVGSISGGSTFGEVAELLPAADGNFVMIASAINSNTRSSVALRFNADGTPDTGYGISDTGAAAIAGFEAVQGAVQLAGDQTLVVGYTTVNSTRTLSSTRLNADGSTDTSYGSNGVRTYPQPPLNFNFSHNFTDLIALEDGRFAATITGPRDGTSSNALYYMILLADGSLDSSVGPNGEGVVYRGPINGNPLTGTAMAQRTDGGVVVAGFADGVNGTSQDRGVLALVFGGSDSSVPVDDTTPDAYSFTAVTGVALESVQTSGIVTITGIDAAADLSVSGGLVSINGGDFSGDPAQVFNNDTVQLRHTAANQFATATTTTLSIGGVSASFVSTTRAADSTPDAFIFTDQSQVQLSTEVISNTVTVSGIEVAVAISVSGGEYAIGCETTAFTGEAGTINNGETVCVRHTSASTEETATNTTLEIGAVSDVFTSTTRGAVILDSTPDAFSFVDQADVAPESVVTSAPVTISGIDTAAQVTVTGGEYSVNCEAGTYSAAAGTISNGQTICVRHTAAAGFATMTNTTLTIGGVMDSFTSTTSADPANGETEQVNTPSGVPAQVNSSTGLIENLVNSATPPAGTTPPQGVSFDDGYFSFDITGLAVGGSTTVTITLPAGAAPDTYYKVQGGSFFEFLFDGTDGAQINGNVITLTLVDGGRGDADGVANGVIVDPGAPGSSSTTTTVRANGGGAFNPLLLMVMLLFAGIRLRGRKAS